MAEEKRARVAFALATGPFLSTVRARRCRQSALAAVGASVPVAYGIVVVSKYERSLQDGVTE